MQVPYIRAAIDETAYNLGEKLKSVVEHRQIDYVSGRLCQANARLGDTFRNASAEKYLNKVGKKAVSDWASMHKVQNFILNNSQKLAKGAVIGGIAAAATAATVGLVHLVKNAANKNSK